MTNVKNSFFVVLVLLIGFSSCTKEDTCTTAPAISENIVGTWLLEGGDGNTFQFLSDGTLNDPSGEMIDIEFNGVKYSDKTYMVANDSLTITATNPNDNTLFSSITVPVIENECETITLDFFGISADMDRQ